MNNLMILMKNLPSIVIMPSFGIGDGGPLHIHEGLARAKHFTVDNLPIGVILFWLLCLDLAVRNRGYVLLILGAAVWSRELNICYKLLVVP